MVYKEPSMYDKLLMTLGSSSKSVATASKQRIETLILEGLAVIMGWIQIVL
ncbi:unnamed protein product [Prunus armeniaca]|uniref:Uncharacterized protein n=1 Tax=Prunus armeniaca TaxID=36596 RepID=A0A6J5Y7K1_PRUAR|nr:unnamed protein product [Prunus armeniaca]CAB4319468.1 unnamed protein product [Prunus armeniaca]